MSALDVHRPEGVVSAEPFDTRPDLDPTVRVMKMGEIFGEFGFLVGSEAQNLKVSRWRLRVANDNHMPVYDEILSTESQKKVVKLKAAATYLVQVCVFSEARGAWGRWSSITRTRTFPPVQTSIAELCEEHVRITWNRQVRDATQIAVEEEPDAMERVSQVERYQLRIVRETDMHESFVEEFPVGVRSHTLYDLRPGTAYIVFARYATLIGTMKQWSEVARFMTQQSHVLQLTARGEDQVGVRWDREDLPEVVGYFVPESSIHKFELSLENNGETKGVVELPASVSSHVFFHLQPSTLYKVRFRCLTKEGRWTSRTKPLVATTIDLPKTAVAEVGETFATVKWSRAGDEKGVLQHAEMEVATVGRGAVKRFETRSNSGEFSVTGLQPSTSYVLRLRTRLEDCWGLWTSDREFRTCESTHLSLAERGEDYLTVTLTAAVKKQADRWFVSVSRIDPDNTRVVVLETEVNDVSGRCRIEDLQSNTTYEIRGRAWQRNPTSGEESWGEYSTPVTGRTLSNISLQRVDIGEHFAVIAWTRDLLDHESNRGASETDQLMWGDAKYELTLGEPFTGNDHLLHHQILDTEYKLTNLRPNATYRVSVRACNQMEQWGQWRSLTFHTLPTVVLTPHDIGEDYARFMWRRKELLEREEEDVPVAPDFVSQYCLFIFTDDNRIGAKRVPSEHYRRGGDSDHVVLRYIGSKHESTRVDQLLPDRTYTAVVRAATQSNEWGLWSEEVKFRTVAPCRISLSDLSVGENYIHVVWEKPEKDSRGEFKEYGDYGIIDQELRFAQVDPHMAEPATTADHEALMEVSKSQGDKRLLPNLDRFKISGLIPATPYSLQIRVCNTSGEWGQWCAPVTVFTRPTLQLTVIDCTEDSVTITWKSSEKKNVRLLVGQDPISAHVLRVQNRSDVGDTKVRELKLDPGQGPFKVPDLRPDTLYSLEIKAKYSDDWGMWSIPEKCRTMKQLEIRIQTIAETRCTLQIIRQPRTRTEEDGKTIKSSANDREQLIICVTSPVEHGNVTSDSRRKPRLQSSTRLPEVCAHENLVTELPVSNLTDDLEVLQAIPALKSNTLYSVTVRSRFESETGSEWGMWSQTVQFITLAPIRIRFTEIGEDFVGVDWSREAQDVDDSAVLKGVDTVFKSKLKLRHEQSSSVCDVPDGHMSHIIPKLTPATTYGVSVHTWTQKSSEDDPGRASEEVKFRTIPTMGIHVEHIGEDAVWLTWMRKSDLTALLTPDVALSTDTEVQDCELLLTSDSGFKAKRQVVQPRKSSRKGGRCFFRGLMPDRIYEVKVRANNRIPGLWSSIQFRTLPTMLVTLLNIGEQFAVLEWRRDHATQSTNRDVIVPDDVVEQFRLRVQMGDSEPVVYRLPSTVSNFRLNQLEPAAEYRVWLCAQGREGVWGQWNNERRFRTRPQLELNIDDIGEDYVAVSWQRLHWEGDAAGDVVNREGAVSGYEVKIEDTSGNEILTVPLSHTVSSWRPNEAQRLQLDVSSVYAVAVRARDTYGEWGLWSKENRFITLRPVAANLLRLGEDFATFEWEREDRLAHRSGSFEESEEMSEATEESYTDSTYSDDMVGGTQFQATGFTDGAALDADIRCGNDQVQAWEIRLYSSRLSGSQPGVEDFQRLNLNDKTQETIRNLPPASGHTFTVRARNATGEWGRWSNMIKLQTMPLIKPHLKCVGEDFVSIEWHRPILEQHHSDDFGDDSHAEPLDNEVMAPFQCFPGPHAPVHNYQVFIAPLEREAPFDDDDLVDGGRLYDHSQPHFRLNNLRPGTRYKIYVREQQLAESSRKAFSNDPVSHGIYSEVLAVETVEKMRVDPENISEDSVTLRWHREKRPDTGAESAAMTYYNAIATAYDLEIYRMDDSGRGRLPKSDPDGMYFRQRFGAAKQDFSVVNLMADAIYGVRVMAETDGSHWGQWSDVTRFVTQKKLALFVDSVNEESIAVSWERARPDWAEEPDLDADPSLEDKRSIIIGDYDVDSYQLALQNVHDGAVQEITVSNQQQQFSIVDLTPNRVYALSVQSKSLNGRWSGLSPKRAVCTLKQLELSIASRTEHYAVLSWRRPEQSRVEHQAVLNSEHLEVRRKFDADKARLLKEIQRLQAEEKEGAPPGRGEETTVTHTDAEFCLRQMEAESKDVASFLTPESLIMGTGEVTTYHLRVFGENGMPRIAGAPHNLDHRRRNKRRPPQPPQPQARAARSRSRKGTAPDVFDGVDAAAFAQQPPEENDDANLLLDVKVTARTNSVCILGLEESSDYSVELRGRVTSDWGLWSSRCGFSTLQLLTLEQERVGEHYAYLFWHRLEPSIVKQHESERQALAIELANKASRDQEDLALLRERQRGLQRFTTSLHHGEGEDIAQDQVEGYLLRLVHENGTVADKYFSAGDPHRFSTFELSYNSLYVAMLCADYGNGQWGLWSPPVKFMTQNIIQLSVNYVSEDFIDIEWKRAVNKRKHIEGVLVVASNHNSDQQYEVELRRNGATVETRTVHNATQYRVEELNPDSRYDVRVREFDSRRGGEVGERKWGLWSDAKACNTLPVMGLSVGEVGEDWMTLSWERLTSAINNAQYDATPVALTHNAEAYYLRIREVTDVRGELCTVGTETPEAAEDEGPFEEDDLLDTDNKQLTEGAPLPPRPSPVEMAPVDGELYQLVKRFPYGTTAFRVEGMRANRFYTVQIMCEMSLEQRGLWSQHCFVATLPKVKCALSLVDERSVRINWERPPVQWPAKSKVLGGSYDCLEYEMEMVAAVDPAQFHMTKTFGSEEFTHSIEDLAMNTVYVAKVRSRDALGRVSVWSDELRFVTQTRMRVVPGRVAEESIHIEWGREAYAPDIGDVLLPPSTARSYRLRVAEAHQAGGTWLDRVFAGTISSFKLGDLRCNTAYIVQCQACNENSDWGMWSEERVIYTMRPIIADVMAVGERYVTLQWTREPPTELPDTVRVDEHGTEVPDTHAGSSERVLPRYPLLDVPREENPVYRTTATVINRYAVRVLRSGDTEPVELYSPASRFKIEGLDPDTEYTISVRAEYGDEWGLWSSPKPTGTQRLQTLYLESVGEDYLSAGWPRSKKDGVKDLGPKVPQHLLQGVVEKTLCVELQVHDFSDLSANAAEPVEPSELQRHCVFCRRSARSHHFDTLQANRQYRVRMRRWYLPFTADRAALDLGDKNESDLIRRRTIEIGGEPGEWSENMFVTTLKNMVVIPLTIAEDFVDVRLERDPHAPRLPNRVCEEFARLKEGSELEVYEHHDTGEENVRHHTEPKLENGVFRITELRPDQTYSLRGRCKDSGNSVRLGNWSVNCYVLTMPKISVSLPSIGEDYVTVTWERKFREVYVDGTRAATGTVDVEKYQLEMFGLQQPYHLEKKFKSSRLSYRFKRLDPNTLYSVAIRSAVTENETSVWSLWSDNLSFATLKPLRMTFGGMGEQFAHIAWAREEQCVEEYEGQATGLQLGHTEVSSYHLCVFQHDQSPTAAMIDRQVSGGTAQQCVTGLSPSTTYVGVVRACDTAGHWGLWSSEQTFTTLKLIDLQVKSIGENYVQVKWSREMASDSQGKYHIGVASDHGSRDEHFTTDDLAKEDGEWVYTVRQLLPDTPYIVTLQACSGENQWGLWSTPKTVLTLSKFALLVSNITEDKADFTWGRGAQTSDRAYDPGTLVWSSTVSRYQLIVRTYEHWRRLEEQRGGAPSPASQDSDDDEPGAARVIERELEARGGKQAQTFCSIDSLMVSTDYHVQIRAQDVQGEWGEWAEVIFDTAPLPPRRPQLKKRGDPKTQTLVFTWDPPDSAGYVYRVEHTLLKRGPRQQDALVEKWVNATPESLSETEFRLPASSKNVTAAQLSKLRCRVRCCKIDTVAHSWSKFSSVATLGSAAPPDSVTEAHVVSTTQTTAVIAWAAALEESSYKVTLWREGDRSDSTEFVTPDTSYEFSDLTPATRYQWQITVEGEGGVAKTQLGRFQTDGDRRQRPSMEKLPAIGRQSQSQVVPRPPDGQSSKRPVPGGKRAPSTARTPKAPVTPQTSRARPALDPLRKSVSEPRTPR